MSSRWRGRPLAGAISGIGWDTGWHSRAAAGWCVRLGLLLWQGCGRSVRGVLARLGADGSFGFAVPMASGGSARWSWGGD